MGQIERKKGVPSNERRQVVGATGRREMERCLKLCWIGDAETKRAERRGWRSLVLLSCEEKTNRNEQKAKDVLCEAQQ